LTCLGKRPECLPCFLHRGPPLPYRQPTHHTSRSHSSSPSRCTCPSPNLRQAHTGQRVAHDLVVLVAPALYGDALHQAARGSNLGRGEEVVGQVAHLRRAAQTEAVLRECSFLAGRAARLRELHRLQRGPGGMLFKVGLGQIALGLRAVLACRASACLCMPACALACLHVYVCVCHFGGELPCAGRVDLPLPLVHTDACTLRTCAH